MKTLAEELKDSLDRQQVLNISGEAMSSPINSEDIQTPEEVYQWVKRLMMRHPVKIAYSKKNKVTDLVDAVILSRTQSTVPDRKTILHILKPRKNTP